MNGKSLDFVLYLSEDLPPPSCLGKFKQSIYFHLSMIHIVDELRETSTSSRCHKMYLLRQTPTSPSTYVGRLCVRQLREAALTWFLGATLRNFLTPRSVLKIMTGSSNNFPTSHLSCTTSPSSSPPSLSSPSLSSPSSSTPAQLRRNPKDHAWIILPPPVEQQLSKVTLASSEKKCQS